MIFDNIKNAKTYFNLDEKIKKGLEFIINNDLNNYSKDGGISLAEWKEINTAITKEENTRDNINRWLKEVANHYIPFIIIEKQLRVLLSELQDILLKQHLFPNYS